MTVAEHTWGWNGGNIIRHSWSNPELAHSLATDTQFQTAVETWREQRAFISNAVAVRHVSNSCGDMIAIANFFRVVEGHGCRHQGTQIMAPLS